MDSERIQNLALDAAGQIGKLEFYGKRKTRDIVTATDIITDAIQKALKEIENWPRCECGSSVLFDQEEPFAVCGNGHGMEWGFEYDADKWRVIQKMIMSRVSSIFKVRMAKVQKAISHAIFDIQQTHNLGSAVRGLKEALKEISNAE